MRGTLFFLVVLLLSLTPLFTQWELALLDLRRGARAERNLSTDHENVYSFRDVRTLDEPLKGTYDLVLKLKELGVKGILVEYSGAYVGRDSSYVDSLAKSGIVVFGVYPQTRFGTFHFGKLTQAPGEGLLVDRPNLPSNATWGVFANRYDDDGISRTFMPYGCTMWQEADTVPDVAVLIAGKYFDIPGDVKPRRDKKAVRYGYLEIPVMSDGSAFVVAQEWNNLVIDVGDSLTLIPRFSGNWQPSLLRGAVVSAGNKSGSVKTILGGMFVNSLWPGSSFVILLAAASFPFVLALRMKPRILWLTSFVLGLVFALFSFILFVFGGVYVEMTMPTLTLVVGGTVFAYFRHADDNAALELEKQRLLESQKSQLEVLVADRTKELRMEKEETERLLYNILPVEIARELKEHGSIVPRRYEEVTILFTDFRGFTNTVAVMPAGKLVAELNEMFKEIDDIIEVHGIEKIKTIGDSYMVAAGLPKESRNHAVQCVRAALDIMRYVERRNETSAVKWQMRVGIHSGSAVAGVVGKRKFTYDVWGDTVNIASRMETAGEPGKINVSAFTYDLVKEHFECQYRGKIETKGKGDIDMYFVMGVKAGWKDESAGVKQS